MPVGAFGGRRDIMQAIAPLGPVYQAGTLSGNPVAVAAGLATLKLVQAPGFYDALAATTRTLCERLTARRAAAGIAFSAHSVGGMFGLYFRETPPQSYAEVMQCDVEAFQPLLPRDAGGRRLSRAVGCRSGLRIGGARRGRDREDGRCGGCARLQSAESVETSAGAREARASQLNADPGCIARPPRSRVAQLLRRSSRIMRFGSLARSPDAKRLSCSSVYCACWPARRGNCAGMPAPFGPWHDAHAAHAPAHHAAAVNRLPELHELGVARDRAASPADR